MTKNQTFFEGLEDAGRKYEARLEARTRNNALKHVNRRLAELGRVYHESVPLRRVDELLTLNGFDALPDMILCGRDGRLHEPVGKNIWLSLSWHKMESGRYEIVAYLS